MRAISFSPRGEVVRVAVERHDGAVIFSVTDRGPGIPAEISERVFDRFFRGGTAEIGGYDIGDAG